MRAPRWRASGWRPAPRVRGGPTAPRHCINRRLMRPGRNVPRRASGSARWPRHEAIRRRHAPSGSRSATLPLAGLDTEAQAGVRVVLARPPADLEGLLAWSEGLGVRGFGSAAVRLGWQAALLAPGNVRVLRAIFPWPNRTAVEAEAQEFGVDALLLAALVRQESVFDVEALSPAGARGLAQPQPSTAALLARGLDVTFYPDWITVPDLNLHLGAAHLAELLRRFGRVDAAVAAYNAGPIPVRRWLERAGAADADRFIELIPYPETRGYVRSLLRNRELYRALYAP